MPYIWKDTEIEQPINRSFTKNEIQYPPNWIMHSNPDQRAAIGLEWIDDDRPRKNKKYYHITGRRGDWTVTPRDLDSLKVNAIANCKKVAATRLARTDWYVIRKADEGTAIPDEVIEFRTATRAYSNELEVTINAADFEGIQKINEEWPKSPEEREIKLPSSIDVKRINN
jgi:hypothetical protein